MPRPKKYGFSWSWKRASGLSAMKGKVSRQLGVPLTRSGRQRKIGRMAGCMLPMVVAVCIAAIRAIGGRT